MPGRGIPVVVLPQGTANNIARSGSMRRRIRSSRGCGKLTHWRSTSARQPEPGERTALLKASAWAFWCRPWLRSMPPASPVRNSCSRAGVSSPPRPRAGGILVRVVSTHRM
ncbi:hypothetical protein [Skermanella aerolata]